MLKGLSVVVAEFFKNILKQYWCFHFNSFIMGSATSLQRKNKIRM